MTDDMPLWLWNTLVEIMFTEPRELDTGYCCGVAGCNQIATVVAHWPGQDGRRCDVHRGWSAHVAEALGFKLHTTPLPVRRFDVAPDAARVRVEMLELV